jgi:hypothetical protein
MIRNLSTKISLTTLRSCWKSMKTYNIQLFVFTMTSNSHFTGPITCTRTAKKAQYEKGKNYPFLNRAGPP